jgi:flavin-dependent dehydrogenase
LASPLIDLRVAVLGGGPAAGAAALALARAGAAVDVYAPERRGEKPCGGAVPEFVLEEVPGFDPAGLPACVSPRAVVENAAGGRLELELDGLRIFRRGDFDGGLLRAAEAAGAGRHQGRADELRWEGERVVVVADGAAREYDWVGCGDGARSLGRRALGLEPRGDSVGLGGSLRGLEWSTLVLVFPDAPGGSYLWIFPRPGGASIGIAYDPTTLSNGAAAALLRSTLDRFLPAGWQALPASRYRYPIPVYGPWTLPAIETALARRLLLVGDAAALADPLTREGIRYALLSGRWAAEALLAGDAAGYPRRVAAAWSGEMARARSAGELYFDDRVGQWLVPVARALPGVRRVLADLLACRQPYRGLRRRLLRAALSPRSGSPRALAP